MIKAIDKKARKLTLKLPNGHGLTTDVKPSVKILDPLKVGDSIHARSTRALAVAIETP